MIAYATLGTNNLPRAVAFYDELLAGIGAKRMMESERYVFWSVSPSQAALAVITPFDGSAATVGNGGMISLAAENSAQVDALHKKALELGATDEGAPGKRGDAFYIGYFRDLDGIMWNSALIALCQEHVGKRAATFFARLDM